jgi:hypothetical protein
MAEKYNDILSRGFFEEGELDVEFRIQNTECRI